MSESPDTVYARVIAEFKQFVESNQQEWKKRQNTEICLQLVKRMYDTYYAMHKNYEKEWHRKLINYLAEYVNGNRDICDVLCWVVEEAKEPLLGNEPYANAIHIVLNVTKLSVPLAKYVPQKKTFMIKLRDTLGSYSFNKYPNSDTKTLIIRNLKVVYSFTLRDENIPILRDMKFGSVLIPYLSFVDNTIKWPSILCLAYLMKEEDCHYLAADTHVFDYFLKILREALDSPTRTSKDENNVNWAVWELGRLIEGLARNDGNKTLLVDKGFLPLLVEMTRSTKTAERRGGLQAIRSLSFAEENKSAIVQEPGLIALIKEIKTNKNVKAEFKETCGGILWNIFQRQQELVSQSPEGPRTMRSSPVPSGRPASANAVGHIMISYQWDNQPDLIRIRDKLISVGQKVWMDIDEMEGSTLEAMAEAVEKADIVLMCVSSKYKESHNCRTEAEYAHRLKKNIIPLLMEDNYEADGWLGIMMGARLYYDFGGKFPFEEKLTELVKAIEKRRTKITPVEQPVVTAPSTPPVSKPGDGVTPEVRSWSKQQVREWLNRHDLTGEQLQNLSGRELASLIKLKSSPDLYYATLKNDLGLNLFTLDSFDEALAELC